MRLHYMRFITTLGNGLIFNLQKIEDEPIPSVVMNLKAPSAWAYDVFRTIFLKLHQHCILQVFDSSSFFFNIL